MDGIATQLAFYKPMLKAKSGQQRKAFLCAPWLIAAFGIAVTVWITRTTIQQIDKDARHALQTHALSFQTAIQTRLQGYEDLLFGVAGLYQAGGKITPDRFDAYARELDIETRFPALGSLNYAAYVPAPERQAFIDAFLKEMADAGQSASADLAPGNAEYMVLTRAYPRASVQLGFNLFGNMQRWIAPSPFQLVGQLYQPHAVTSTGMPVRPPGKSELALAARLGIFMPGRDGKDRLIGTAGIAFNIETFFSRVTLPQTLKQARYRVDSIGRENGITFAHPVRVYTSPARSPDASRRRFPLDEAYSTFFTVSFGDALLRVDMDEDKSELISQRDALLPAIACIVGLLMTLLATVLFMKILNRNRELQKAIRAQTSDLARENERARELERELTHVAEEERRRIGHELHDDLGQRLTGMSLSAKALSGTLEPILPALSRHAASIEREASDAIATVRGLAHGLMPVPSEPHGLRNALEQLSLSVSSLYGVQCIFDFEDPVDIADPNIAANLYRIAQEAINNAVRHARASIVNVRLDYEHDKVTLTVADNGIGFEQDDMLRSQTTFASGAGLRIMSYRAAVIGFRLTVQSPVGHGTTIKVQEC